MFDNFINQLLTSIDKAIPFLFFLYCSSPGAANMTLLFEGQENHLVPSTSQMLADSDLFVVAGRMIGHSFLNDGPRLHGLSKAIIHMLVHADRDTVTVQLDDVPDLDIPSTICMVNTNLLQAFVKS